MLPPSIIGDRVRPNFFTMSLLQSTPPSVATAIVVWTGTDAVVVQSGGGTLSSTGDLALGAAGTNKPKVTLSTTVADQFWALASGETTLHSAIDRLCGLGFNVAFNGRIDSDYHAIGIRFEHAARTGAAGADRVLAEYHVDNYAADGTYRRMYSAACDIGTVSGGYGAASNAVTHAFQGLVSFKESAGTTELLQIADTTAGPIYLQVACRTKAVTHQTNNAAFLCQRNSTASADIEIARVNGSNLVQLDPGSVGVHVTAKMGVAVAAAAYSDEKLSVGGGVMSNGYLKSISGSVQALSADLAQGIGFAQQASNSWNVAGNGTTDTVNVTSTTVILKTGTTARVTAGADSVKLEGALLMPTTITPSALAAGETNNYNPTGLSSCSRISVAADVANSQLSGIVAQPNGTRIVIHNNVAAGNLVLEHEDASSTDVNRFRCANAGNVTIRPLGSATIEYITDGSINRWLVLTE